MKRIGLTLAIFSCIALNAQVNVSNLQCENKPNPTGIDVRDPQLSWQLNSKERNISQTAYEVCVSTDAKDLTNSKSAVWSSGRINSDQSVYVTYAGTKLTSNTKYFWKVRIWDNKNRVSKWSETAYWQTGLYSATDWKAKWIEPGYVEDTLLRPSPIFRKEFQISKKIKSATAFITSHGLYEGAINGQRIGDAMFTPGWTSYNKRLQYQTYDISNLLKSGKNTIGVTLASGWYRGILTWNPFKNIWGSKLALLAQIEIEYNDGSKETVVTDESWKSSTGSIAYAELYNGEWIDHRKEQTGWSSNGFDDSKWSGVKVADYSKSVLVASNSEPARKKEAFYPVRIFRTPLNELVADFGQNLVGILQMKIRANKGDSIRISHAEVLDKKGNFYTDNLRTAQQLALFIPGSNNEETFEPRFTYMGFRYIKIENYKGEIKPGDLIAHAVYADMKPTGTFNCSDTLINKLQHNIQWGQKGNFLDVPTDCPQRDERLGWTGDAQVFFPTGAFNMQINNFFTKWMRDVAADQLADGGIPATIPNPFCGHLKMDANSSSGWADVSTIVPWDMYLLYGDKRILSEQYESMKKWVGCITSQSVNDLWTKGWHFGDWLSYAPDNDWQDRAARTDKQLIGQSFYIYSTQIVAEAARILNKTEDYKFYSDMLAREKKAYINEYLTPNGRLISNTQTAYILALQFDILPENMRGALVDRLVKNIHEYNDHLTTGFLGAPYLCHVLTKFGHTDLAYKLLMQKDYPSWLYQVSAGATTIWERWDGQKPDGTFQDKGMNSFNHYAYGAIGDWMYQTVAGIKPDNSSPGYKKIIIKPQPGGELTNASASYLSSYGKIASSWKINGKRLSLNVSIPCNTSAMIYIPVNSSNNITEGGKLIQQMKTINIVQKSDKYIELSVGSGEYHFEADL